MSELEFNFRDSIQRVFTTEDGKDLYVGSEVCRNLGREDNFARTIKTYVKAKWWIEYPNPNGGKPILCLFEPGVYQLASNPIFNTEWADQFQDFMFEVVVPKLKEELIKSRINSTSQAIVPLATAHSVPVLPQSPVDIFDAVDKKFEFSDVPYILDLLTQIQEINVVDKALREQLGVLGAKYDLDRFEGYGATVAINKLKNSYRIRKPFTINDIENLYPLAVRRTLNTKALNEINDKLPLCFEHSVTNCFYIYKNGAKLLN
jgi:hypothetical protein